MALRLASYNGMSIASAFARMRLPKESKKNATLIIHRSRHADSPHRVYLEAEYGKIAITYPQLLCFKLKYPEIDVFNCTRKKNTLEIEFSIPNKRVTKRPGFFEDLVKKFLQALQDLFIYPQVLIYK